ncbi:MAG TPA: histidine kinase dimerization/phospho-acceptor domain-containing protein, partial [Erythrobacter sp.]|nr:histidine kinase dimerization/phospho-acceptor domain-containing protein [Erythrobacter sp.]
MFFDDRLATVLRQRATGEAGLRTQFRQLLDLLGKDRAGRGNSPDHSLLAAAWLRMDALAEAIPAEERARMVREPGWRFRSPDLASHLADHEPEVASAALNRAELSSEDWQALIPRLPVRARGFLRNRRDLPVDVEALLGRLGVHDRGLPAPAPAAASARHVEERPAAIAPIPLRPVTSSPSNTRDRDDSGRTEISALVERIAQFRRERSDNRQEFEHSPRLPLGELPERSDALATSFGFAADAGGRIEWASADVAPMVVGTRLFAAQRLGDEDSADVGLERAFARRQPITGGAVSLAGAPAIAGDWLIDAQPRFSEDGHFTGYFGRLRRVRSDSDTSLAAEAREADRIRQLLHELRTPVTAVQGYAEVIQQQLFGPAPHEYRALAAAIAADAARILAGFEELDRLARLETGAMRVEPGECDLAGLLHRTIEQIMPVLVPRGSALQFDSAPDAALLIAIDLEDAEALVWRVLASIAAACGPEEHLTVTLAPLIGAKGALARMTATLPAALAAEDNLFAA